MTAIRVLLVDDHPVVRNGLKGLVQGQPDMVVVGEAGDGEFAVAEAGRLLPDVVVMDLSLPGVGGLQATARIRRQQPGVRVVVLTAHEGDAYAGPAREAGAAGYVPKRAAADELIRAIRRAATEGPVPASPARDPETPAPPPQAGGTEGLSGPEADVLRMVAGGLLNREIAARLGLDADEVGSLKAAAMGKLGLQSRASVVGYASRAGWLAGRSGS